MKLWNKGYATENIVESYTVGQDQELDFFLAPFDVLGSMAHASMLKEVGLLSAPELEQLKEQLRIIYQASEKGEFQIEAGVEDVHSQVELMLTRQLGMWGRKFTRLVPATTRCLRR